MKKSYVRIMTTLVLSLSVALTLAGLAACTPNQEDATTSATAYSETVNPEIQTILDHGVLRVGVKDDTPGFGFFNPEIEQYEGLEIDLAHLLAEEILGSREAVEFTPVTAGTRGNLLDSKQIDLVIATFTIREERTEFWNFSQYYFVDAVGLMVIEDSGLNRLSDFGGRTIAVIEASTTREAIEQHIEDMSYDIAVNFQEFPTNQDAVAALESGQVDAFSVDKVILSGFLTEELVILPESFNPQEYGIASRLNSPYLTRLVDAFITQIKLDGTLEQLKAQNNVID